MQTSNHTIFTPEFTDVDPNEIVHAVRTKGFFAFPRAIRSEALTRIEEDATRNRLGVNLNQLSGVYAWKQYYFVNLLAASKSFYDYCTSDLVRKICREYLGPAYRLKALRYYETFGGHHMQWHTDNKTDRSKADIPGLIFIFYVSDVTDGEFQYIEGSHAWSGEKAYSDYSDEYIHTNFSDKIASFKMPRGSLVIYNTYGIHRAKPVFDESFIRKSVFFQVDSGLDASEPIILNSEFIEKPDEETMRFLGFGLKADYEVFPKTGLQDLPLSKTVFKTFGSYFLGQLRVRLGLRSRLRSIASRWRFAG